MDEQKRPAVVQWTLVVLAGALAHGLVHGTADIYEDLAASRSPQWRTIVTLLQGLVSAAAFIGLVQMRRWGFYGALFALAVLAVFFASSFLRPDTNVIMSVLFVCLPIVMMVLLLRSRNTLALR